MYQHVLIPYDGSDEGLRGAMHGIELASAVGADVHALYVIDLPGVPRALSLRDDEEQLREEYNAYADKILAQIQEVADDHGVVCETARRSGSVADEITEYAEEEGMDVVVMASAYRGRIGTLLGGTTDKVVRTATVPVLTQRMGYDEI
ncbi:universal stress protein [Halomarina rubra]|uniref:Universal stress protein n=1 Tax=Halomarina rubra TaxID=2071873 RepID=A0ABD6AXL2_9EURY|nr:universal stress protein [Halomarina rubra]